MSRKLRRGMLVLTVVGLGVAIYLTYRELFSIHAICEWCASSAVILTILLVCAVIRYVITDDSAAVPAATSALSRARATRA